MTVTQHLARGPGVFPLKVKQGEEWGLQGNIVPLWVVTVASEGGPWYRETKRMQRGLQSTQEA